MASDEDPLDWLPSGWTLQIRKINDRKIKCFVDPEGQKFYSKSQVFQHLQTITNGTANENNYNADGSPQGVQLDVSRQNNAPDSLPQNNGDHLAGGKSASQPDLSEGNGTSGSLPSGWIVQMTTTAGGRKCKCYVDPETGRKLYSKPEVFRYLKNAQSSKASEKTETVGSLTGDGTSSDPDATQKDSKWLPDGWTVEVKTRDRGSGKMNCKCYTDPVSGRKFYSKPQVLNFLATRNSSEAGQQRGNKSSSKPDMSQKSPATEVGHGSKSKRKREKIRKAIDDEVISRTPVDGLPPGWIKEVRVRKNAVVRRKDPYYVDPLSDYMFRSKLDALRYLETGDIKNCAMKPSKRDIDEIDLYNDDHLTLEKWDSPTDLSKRNVSSSLIPAGWVVEVKRKASGAKYKRYIDPESGRKFHSVPEISRYLNSVNSSSKASDNTHDGGNLTGEKQALLTYVSKGNETSDPLPPGWVVQVKTKSTGTKYKEYVDPESGRKFQSRPQVARYLKSGSKARGKTGSVGRLSGCGSSSRTDAAQKTEVSDWLPDGWVMEVKTVGTRGQKHKCYTESITGRKFYSKPQVLKYLAANGSSVNGPPDMPQNSGATGSRGRRSRKKGTDMGEFDNREVISRTPADGLPPGWIKEIRARKHGTQTDPYYFDPLSGYIFRSKLDALRYLDTGDVKFCAIKPLKRDMNGKDTSNCAIDGEDPGNTTPRRQLFEDSPTPKESGNSSHTHARNIAPTKTPEEKIGKRGNRTTRSKTSPTTFPERSSKRLKGLKPETKGDPLVDEQATRGPAVQPETEGKGHLEDTEAVQDGRVNVEKQSNEEMAESETSYPLGENMWTDPCLDFAVKTLTGEILGEGQQASVEFEAGKNEDPMKVNQNEDLMKVN